jgi:hypothetical protein
MESSEFRVYRPSEPAERADYLRGIASWRSGFVGAFRWGSHRRIHRADRPDIQKPTSATEKKEAVRVCSRDRQEIERWAMDEKYGALLICGNCRRSGRLQNLEAPKA